MPMNDALHKVLKRLHYRLEIMLTCVRWYAAYPLSAAHREVIPKHKRPVGGSWRMDETYIKVKGV